MATPRAPKKAAASSRPSASRRKTQPKVSKSGAQSVRTAKARCGLCGKTGKLMRTECCGNWICNDHDKYVVFSYARNSCARNHSRYTLCGYHHTEGHAGNWKECRRCLDGFEPEMAAWYGTNEYNFEKHPDPPKFEPTRCANCDGVIRLSVDGYSVKQGKHYCMNCSDFRLPPAPRRGGSDR